MLDMYDIQIILASASPRRKDILKRFFKSFKIIPSTVDEEKIMQDNSSISELSDIAIKLSSAKALDVASKNKNSIVIGADTIVICNDKLLGKPKDTIEAYAMLSMISNNVNCVITGVTLVFNDFVHSFFDRTSIKLKEMDECFINQYIESKEPFDKSGAYGIQSLKDKFLDEIDGDIDNVIGFPLAKFEEEFKAFLTQIKNSEM